MSWARHYRQKVVCPLHPECLLYPHERCSAQTQQGRRCFRRAAPGSTFCANGHGGSPWSQEIGGYRRGNPLELEHRLGSGSEYVETYQNMPLRMLEMWGPVSDQQLAAVVDASMDLEEILR